MKSINSDTPHSVRVQFPDNRSVFIALIKDFHEKGFRTKETFPELLTSCFNLLDALRQSCAKDNPKILTEILSNKDLVVHPSSHTLKSIVRGLNERWTAENEFFSLFDIVQNKVLHEDQRLWKFLGIPTDTFHNSRNGPFQPDINIYLQSDLHHTKRHELITYAVMSISGFKWLNNRDHYILRMRISTKNSSKISLRALDYVTLEKRSYFLFDNKKSNHGSPRYQFNQYLFYTDLKLECVNHLFVSDEIQSVYLNSFAYMFNLQLFEIPPKYILLLDERQTHDRNKTVAKSLQEKIKFHTGKSIFLDEHKIADCFAKTIRHRIEEIFNLWDNRKNGNRIIIESDAQCVQCAKILGLLPVPNLIKEIIYGMIANHQTSQ